MFQTNTSIIMEVGIRKNGIRKAITNNCPKSLFFQNAVYLLLLTPKFLKVLAMSA
jgi:hypothetical protein